MKRKFFAGSAGENIVKIELSDKEIVLILLVALTLKLSDTLSESKNNIVRVNCSGQVDY